jgi:hypothetical protein
METPVISSVASGAAPPEAPVPPGPESIDDRLGLKIRDAFPQHRYEIPHHMHERPLDPKQVCAKVARSF